MMGQVGGRDLGGFAKKPPDGRFLVLGLKTKGELEKVKVWAEGTWRHPQAYFREKGSQPCPSDASSTEMDQNAPKWNCILFSAIGIV